MTGAAVGLLREALSERVDTDPSHLDDARADKSGHAAPGRPIAIVHAASIDDVQATMRIATATGTPVMNPSASGRRLTWSRIR